MLAVVVVRLVYYQPTSFDIRAFSRGCVRLLNALFESSMRIAALRARAEKQSHDEK